MGGERRFVDLLHEAQGFVDEHMPSPEEEIGQLSTLVAQTPDTAPYPAIRRLVIEVDDLIAQARWHIAQAVLIIKEYPIIKEAQPKREIDSFPTSAILLLRQYVAGANFVLAHDLSMNRRGGTFAGWTYQMMVDNSVYRSIAFMDRLARIICLVAGINVDRVYFRSKKMEIVHREVQMPESKRLVELAEAEIYSMLLTYRDGLAHTRKWFTRLEGTRIADWVIDEAGNRILDADHDLDYNHLIALANAAYQHGVAVLQASIPVVARYTPGSRTWEEST